MIISMVKKVFGDGRLRRRPGGLMARAEEAGRGRSWRGALLDDDGVGDVDRIDAADGVAIEDPFNLDGVSPL